LPSRTTNAPFSEIRATPVPALANISARLPLVAALLNDGRWTRAAEQELLATAGNREGTQ
jgi:hypothetical protein